MRIILHIFHGEESELPSLTAAFDLARTRSAQLHCLHVSLPVSPYPGLFGEGILLSAPIAAAIEAENKTRLEQSQSLFTREAARQNIPVVPYVLEAAERGGACACFIHHSGVIERSVTQEGVFNDLIILGTPGESTWISYEAALGGALFRTGRPVLIVPQKAGGFIPDGVAVIAWDGNHEASRAAAAALPLLTQARRIILLTLHERDALPSSDRLRHYLSLHGLVADVHIAEAAGRQPGAALLEEARALQANMLVMGAYGHSRFREMVLGGVTEYMLAHADLPLLMAH